MALMKISNYYKDKCHDVEFYNPMDSYDLVYGSQIFDYSHYDYFPENVILGGTGTNNSDKLPREIDLCQLDYSLYPKINYSYQQYSRGCVRKCHFCVVPKMYDNIEIRTPLNINPNSEWIYLMDDNFFASDNWKKSINHLLSINKKVKFEGIDLRILNEEMIHYLAQIKPYKQLHTAWDNPNQDMEKKLIQLAKKIKPYKIMVYVLIGYWSTPEQDMYRIKILDELGFESMVMPYDKNDTYQKRFARWVNRKAIFNSVKWKDYK